MCAAECRKKIVERVLVRDVDDGQLRAHLVSLPVEQVVVSEGDVKETPRGDALWIVVIVLGIGTGHCGQVGPELRRQTRARLRPGPP